MPLQGSMQLLIDGPPAGPVVVTGHLGFVGWALWAILAAVWGFRLCSAGFPLSAFQFGPGSH